MGKGDKRSKRGKITIGSYGKTRPHKVSKPEVSDAGEKTKKKGKKGPGKS